MPITDADVSVAANGDIRWEAGGAGDGPYTVLELHRWLQDKADNASVAGDDILDITDATPSDRSTDNIITLQSAGGGNFYNVDDTMIEHLYDGSITQKAAAERYSGLVVVGSVADGEGGGTNLQIAQDNVTLTSYWGTGLNADAAANILLRIMVKTRTNGANIDGSRIRVYAREWTDTYAEFNATLGLGNGTAAIFTSDDLNNQTTPATTVDGWSGDITNTEGFGQLDVNNDGSDENYYSAWNIAGGKTINDLYEYAKAIQRRATPKTIHGMDGELFRGITHSITYDTESASFSAIEAADESLVWGVELAFSGESGALSIGEYVSFSPSGAVGKLIYRYESAGSGTYIVAKESGSGTITAADTITGLTSTQTADLDTVTGETNVGGIGTLLALDDTGASAGIFHIQLTYGSAPVNNQELTGRSGTPTATPPTALVDTTITARTVSSCFIGNSTGSNIIGAYGIGVEPTDLDASDQLFDLTNTLRQPPNFVTFTVFGLVSGEDYVLVGPEDGGGGLDTAQDTLNGAITVGVSTSIVITGSIPADTPGSGTLRIFSAAGSPSGTWTQETYTSWTGSTFTLTGTAANSYSNGADIFISYIDKLAAATSEAFTGVYSGSPRTVFVRVRDGGGTPIKTFETTGTLGVAGGSSTSIRTPDA